MPVSAGDLQTAILKVLSDPNGRGLSGDSFGQVFFPAVQGDLPSPARVTPPDVMEGVWSLIRQGLAIIDYSQEGSRNWRLSLTATGVAAANDRIVGPDNPGAFFERLSRAVPEASDVVMQYVRESVTAYLGGCYLASSVMIGVASEAAFLEMAQAFGAWLPDEQGTRFLGVINDDRASISRRFKEFRNKLHPYEDTVLRGRFDGLDVDLNGVFDLLREHRNDAGHPRGRAVDRDAVFDHHRMLMRYLRKLYDLRAFFAQDRGRHHPIGQGSGSPTA